MYYNKYDIAGTTNDIEPNPNEPHKLSISFIPVIILFKINIKINPIIEKIVLEFLYRYDCLLNPDIIIIASTATIYG